MLSIQWSLRNMMLFTVFIFTVISFFLFIQHELTVMVHPHAVTQQQDSKPHLAAVDTHRHSEEQVKALGKVGGSRGQRIAKKKPPARLRNRRGGKAPSKDSIVPNKNNPSNKNILFGGKNEHQKFNEDHPAMFPAIEKKHGHGHDHHDDMVSLSQQEHSVQHHEVTDQSHDVAVNKKQIINEKNQNDGFKMNGNIGVQHVHFDPNTNRAVDGELFIQDEVQQKKQTVTVEKATKQPPVSLYNSNEENVEFEDDVYIDEQEEYEDDEYDDDAAADDDAIDDAAAADDEGDDQQDDNKEDDIYINEQEEIKEMELNVDDQIIESNQFSSEKRGTLICDGKAIDSEVIYWKIVPGDDEFESPITPHHGEHHQKFLTFEYDAGGWNNIRMGLECLIVVAHAMGRTLVVPPQEHLYLIHANHKDIEDSVEHDEMGFEDFFDLNILRSQKGFHILHMEQFLTQEGVTGHLKGILPPYNSTTINHRKLARYLNKVADMIPTWWHRFLAFPSKPGDFNMSESFRNKKVQSRMYAFSGNGDRKPIFYDSNYQKAKHIHLPADQEHRILQHHYAFAFFADPDMQSFYRRFVRDYMRYKDRIQCAGHELVKAVRAEALKEAPAWGGEYYAMHIRRGDFQYKDVKISATEMLKNMKHKNGSVFIPSGALVYISTDDPDGVCLNCAVKGKLCKDLPSPKPVGCPEDTSYQAFIDAGFKIRFLKDFLKRGHLKGVNPNTYGMIESIVCSRSKVFVGTYYSTFTGYIHRLRGYHGRGEDSYYHSTRFVHQLQLKKSVGQGWPREWRAGWTDDGGELI